MGVWCGADKSSDDFNFYLDDLDSDAGLVSGNSEISKIFWESRNFSSGSVMRISSRKFSVWDLICHFWFGIP
ncbi:hypothetical protein DVH24_026528 [Malus domestica]|uniref:Uncharacterized protein n=1 Tax=Malus domestica TaxID=3750 RepID=A0A498KNW3_MALDO|nr:hypothetical protein DVH24_026528 [Malus domestica]